MCGLHGWSGKDPQDFNINKLNILGIINETRGKHSCGMSYDGEIYHGVNKNKEWRDFAVNNINAKVENLEDPIVIAHTRWATFGGHTAVNAHPFGFGDNDGKYSFIGAHNGSLINHKELAEMYEISDFEQVKKYKRPKIDSEILLEIIFNHGYEVLNYYLGAAALIWYDTYNPNIMYCYHGKSKLHKTSHTETEERPLYYYQEREGSLYVGSIKEALEMINDTDGEIGQFDHNYIYKITDGNVATAEKILIDRDKECYQKEFTSNYNYNYNKNQTKSLIEASPSNKIDIFLEKPTKTVNKGNVYYNRLRYWRNGHLCRGIFAPIKSNLMYYLGDNISQANLAYKNLSSDFKFDEKPFYFYMHNGIMLETYHDYQAVLQNPTKWDIPTISHMSKYPIIDVNKKAGLIYYMGQPCKDELIPFLSECIYEIKNGRVISKKTKSKDYNENLQFINADDIPVYDMIFNFKKKIKEESHNAQDIKYIETINSEISDAIEDYKEELEDSVINTDTKKDLLGGLISINNYVQKQFEICLKKIKKLPQSVEN